MAHQPAWRRAIRETVSAQQSARFMWGGEAVLAVAGGAWLTAIAPDASLAEQVGRAVGGGLAGLATAVLLIFAWNLIRSPYRQRDEALAENAQLQQQLALRPGSPTAPILAEPQLLFSNLHCGDFGHGGEGNFGGLDPFKFYAYVSAIGNADSPMSITRVALWLDDQELPTARWHTQETWGNYQVSFPAEIPQAVGTGKHVGKVIAFANGKSWRSPEFDVDVPSHEQVVGRAG